MWSQKEEEEKKEYISAFWNFNYTHGGVEGEGRTIDSLPACSVERDERSLKSTGTRRFLLSPQFVQWRATAAYLKTAAQAFHCNGILSQRDDRKNDTERLQSLHSLCQRAPMYLFIYFNNSIFFIPLPVLPHIFLAAPTPRVTSSARGIFSSSVCIRCQWRGLRLIPNISL